MRKLFIQLNMQETGSRHFNIAHIEFSENLEYFEFLSTLVLSN